MTNNYLINGLICFAILSLIKKTSFLQDLSISSFSRKNVLDREVHVAWAHLSILLIKFVIEDFFWVGGAFFEASVLSQIGLQSQMRVPR